MENLDKEVYFGVYCPQCKHWKKSEWEDPCDDCLNEPKNTDSHKPVYFEEDVRRKAKLERSAKHHAQS